MRLCNLIKSPIRKLHAHYPRLLCILPHHLNIFLHHLCEKLRLIPQKSFYRPVNPKSSHQNLFSFILKFKQKEYCSLISCIPELYSPKGCSLLFWHCFYSQFWSAQYSFIAFHFKMWISFQLATYGIQSKYAPVLLKKGDWER